MAPAHRREDRSRTISKWIKLDLLAVACLTVAVDVEAKGPKFRFGPAIPHGQHAPPNTLSQSELRWCVEKQGAIDAEHNAILSARANLDATEKSVDPYNDRAVDAFNVLVDAHNVLVQASNAVIDDWNSRCANRSYYERDMQAIRGEK